MNRGVWNTLAGQWVAGYISIYRNGVVEQTEGEGVSLEKRLRVCVYWDSVFTAFRVTDCHII